MKKVFTFKSNASEKASSDEIFLNAPSREPLPMVLESSPALPNPRPAGLQAPIS